MYTDFNEEPKKNNPYLPLIIAGVLIAGIAIGMCFNYGTPTNNKVNVTKEMRSAWNAKKLKSPVPR